MADERTEVPYHRPSIVQHLYGWSSLGKRSRRFRVSCISAVVIKKDGDELFYQLSGSRCPALARKPGPWLLPRAFDRNEVHGAPFFPCLTHHAPDTLGKEKGLLGLIFTNAQNKFGSRLRWRSPCGGAQILGQDL